ncbi:MAG: hypothetical protein H6975_04245 [Gammaproteobacteria bacterium]|nr:hypothetical protein [Gammaproteobacteria bacterium]
MTAVNVVIVAVVLVLSVMYIYMAAFTSWHISRSEYFESGQKRAQHAIVWLIPILGAAFVLHMLSPDIKRKGPGWIPALEYMILSAFVASVAEASDSAEPTAGDSTEAQEASNGSSND